MRFIPLFAVAAAAVIAAWLPQSLNAQSDDVFAFIPVGGRTLLANIIASHPPADEVKALATGKHTRDEWVSYLKAHATAITTLQSLTDKELLTLADYLSFNMPLPANQMPADASKLPMDGRDFALQAPLLCFYLRTHCCFVAKVRGRLISDARHWAFRPNAGLAK
jgi:hypothetical protein